MEEQKNKNAEYLDLIKDNAPKANDDYLDEAKILDNQIRNPNVYNIGVVAKYGAGKSSAIDTYLSKYRTKEKLADGEIGSPSKNKYVRITLANFKNSKYNDRNSDTDIKNSYNESAIERSILQQLLYSQKKKKLPNSKLERTNKTSKLRTIFISLVFSVFIVSTVMFFVELNGIHLFYVNAKITLLGFAILSIVSLLYILYVLVYYGKLRKIKYKELEVDLGAEGNKATQVNNLLNKFIDEVLYFFECCNTDLVIFEDLDRLPTIEIFSKLRELNTIINNSKKKAKKVTFLYAVKSDIFQNSEERAKFFDFILPIVPVINPNSTRGHIDTLFKELEEENSSIKLTANFKKSISLYVPDMRILNNTFNDYVITYKKIFEGRNARVDLKPNNLFALCLYKNLFPYDYALLEEDRGIIPKIIDMDKLRGYYCEDIKKSHGGILSDADKEQIMQCTLGQIVDTVDVDLIFKDYKNFQNIYGKAISSEIYEKQINYLRFLIVQKYIDENYLEYILAHQYGELSSSDIALIHKIEQFQHVDFNSKVDDIQKFVEWLDEGSFLQDKILIRPILANLHIINKLCVDQNDKKYENIIRLLSSTGNETVINKITEFLLVSTEGEWDRFLKIVIPVRPNICSEVLYMDKLTAEKTKHFIVYYIKYAKSYKQESGDNTVKNYLDECTDYLDIFSKVNDDKKVIMFLDEILPKFKNLSNQDVDGKIQQHIITKNLYCVNLHNLEIVYGINGTVDEDSPFYSKNYDFIMSSNIDCVKDYINSNKALYIEVVWLNDALNCKEEPLKYVEGFLKDKKIGLNLRKKIINKKQWGADKIDLISEYEDGLFSILFENNAIKPTWQNIQTACAKIGIMALVEYIKRVDFIDDASASVPNNPLLIDIIKKLNCDELKNLSSSLPEKALNIYNSVISTDTEKIVILISKGKIQYSVGDLNLIYQKQDILNEYLKIHGEQVLQGFDSFFNKILPIVVSRNPSDKKTAQQIVANVMNCNGIDNIKKKVISKCSSYLSTNGYEGVYKKCIIEEKIAVPYNILKQFATATAIRSEEKVKILIVCLEDIESKLQQSQVKDYLGAFDKSYLEIFNSDYDINKEEDSLRRELYQILNSKNLLQVA